MITIYHNPRCSKSREALAFVEEFAAHRNLPVEVVQYLKTPPTATRLAELKRLLRCEMHEMVRSNEDEYAALQLADADESSVLRAIAAHPKLLQRPIVVYKGRAAIGRPPESLRDLLNAG